MAEELKVSSESLEVGEEFNNQDGADEKTPNLFAETIRLMLIALAIVLPIRMFVVAPFIVDGASMEPSYHNGEYLLVDEVSYRFQEPQRGDVIVFRPPDAPNVYYIKRVIGLPGDTVEIKDGKITLSNATVPAGYLLNETEYLPGESASPAEFSKVTLKENEYFIMGDNRDNSRDSRRIGPVPMDHFKGKVMLRVFPFSKFTFIQRPAYAGTSSATNTN